jgi:outer membrane protein insertion porin family
MLKFTGSLLAFGLAGLPLFAQQPDTTSTAGRCSKPDLVTVYGNNRIDEATVKGTAGIIPGSTINAQIVSRAIKALFSTGNYEDVKIVCTVDPKSDNASIDIHIVERPILVNTSVSGIKKVAEKDVLERLELPVGTALDPSLVARAVDRVDSLYESKGYYLARIEVDSTVTNGELTIDFKIDEGNRLSISGIRINGNQRVSASAIVGAMQTKPEGFWWFRKGEFDEAKYAGDLTQRIPRLYGERGFIDFLVEKDTMIVDRERGKGEIQLSVREGPRYTVGTFEVLGNRRFSTEELKSFYPFDGQRNQSLAETALGILRRKYRNPKGTFDESAWDEATNKVREAYHDQGYIYADIRPVEERVPSSDTIRKVNLRWEIEEGAPAIINRVDIIGNDFTYESCIREQIVMLPGDVFRREYLIRSYQNLSSMNFFEQPMEEPQVQPDSAGDVNITFKVKEKRTGNINFGASMGEGTGLGGFIGLDQPNLFGRCKRAQVQLQFGRYQNDLSLTYQDPNIRMSNISGSVTAYHTRARYQIADLGQSTRTGGQFQFGFPVPRSFYSRLFVSYGGERVKYDDNTGTLLGTLATTCRNCFRSTLGVTFQHDTRVGGMFPIQGSMQSISAQFNGGPLGGTSAFQRYMTELKTYAPIAYIGSTAPGSQPLTFLVGLSARAGAVLGNPGPFFASQSFALGGVQYGEPLRGYCEFAITPAGFDPQACDGQARRESFGNAFFVGTAELGFRVNHMLYFNAFFEGGNVWNRPREFDPTRLFRSVGFGGSTISPLGPLGLDVAYGLDRVDANGRKNPGWKVHFKLGQIF